MVETVTLFWRFAVGSLRTVTRGSVGYYVWIAFLGIAILTGLWAYAAQLQQGLIATNMRDQVSWGFYIGNFAFLVGVAAAAVVLVVPAYIYNWGPIREIVLFGELLSVAAIVMCLLFVMVDIGRPEIFWHMLPIVGTPNFPHSLLSWDILALSSYFLINLFIVTYLIFMSFTGRRYNPNLVMPVIFLSIPLAIAIHTVTAFLFMAASSRAYWHTAILAPRFISSAFCSGPALLFLIFRVLRGSRRMEISDAALYKIGELLAYAMAVNLFFLGAEVFAEFYSPTAHSVHAYLQWFGGHGTTIAVYSWVALVLNVSALIIFMVPALRHRLGLLSAGCCFAVGGVFVEKGMGLLLPGMTPDAMGEIYVYGPSMIEITVGVGIWAGGALLFTLMVKVATAVYAGEMRHQGA